MTAISVLRVAPAGGSQTLEFDSLSDLEGAAAAWSWSDSIEVRSDVFGDTELVGALPVEMDGEDDSVWDVVDLPLDYDGRALTHAVVNNFTWFLLRVGGSTAWVPLPFWEYPFGTIYELSTTTAGGEEWCDYLYQIPGLRVRVTTRSHFNARVSGDPELWLEPGAEDVQVDESVVPAPEIPEDQLHTVELTVPTLDVAASERLAAQLAARCGPGAYVKVNEAVVENEGEPYEG